MTTAQPKRQCELGGHTMESPLRICSQCQTERVPEGGVALNSKRWLCAKCWSAFTQRRHK